MKGNRKQNTLKLILSKTGTRVMVLLVTKYCTKRLHQVVTPVLTNLFAKMAIVDNGTKQFTIQAPIFPLQLKSPVIIYNGTITCLAGTIVMYTLKCQ